MLDPLLYTEMWLGMSHLSEGKQCKTLEKGLQCILATSVLFCRIATAVFFKSSLLPARRKMNAYLVSSSLWHGLYIGNRQVYLHILIIQN